MAHDLPAASIPGAGQLPLRIQRFLGVFKFAECNVELKTDRHGFVRQIVFNKNSRSAFNALLAF
jgi:hypothetical protein